MGQQELELPGYGSGMGTDQEAVGSVGKIPDEDTVKPGLFVNLSCLSDDIRIEDGTGWGNQFRRDAGRDPSDHLNRHHAYLKEDLWGK
jgi:hypothetical protein